MKPFKAGWQDLEGGEKWQQAMFDQKERAKIILDALDEEPELMHEFNQLLRRRKLNKIKDDR